MLKWYENHDVDRTPIISSRIRLARNLSKYAFPTMISDNDANNIINEIADAVRNQQNPLEKESALLFLSNLSSVDKLVLLEQHILSQTMLRSSKSTALLKHDNDSISIMINEEDHIRMQCITPGSKIDEAWQVANTLDDAIERSVDYAFDKDFGYLTACPTNTGTGLRASFMMHLPMLEKTGQIKNVIPAMSKFGMTVRGLYGEGTESLGGIYQISNQITLGKSEQEIIDALKNVAKQVTDNENWLIEKAIKADKAAIEDNVYRSFGVLSTCRKITSKEAASLLSNVRIGLMTGLLDEKSPTQTIYEIMMNCQPASLSKRYGMDLSAAERDIYRATYIRNAITA